jgi:protein TonB
MSPQKRYKRDRSIGFVTSCIAHVTVILIGGIVFAKPIEYAVEAGGGGIEVSLTAAPAPMPLMRPEVLTPKPEEAVKKTEPEPDAMRVPEEAPQEKPIEKPIEQPKALATAADSPFKGDGSSAEPGKDATTFYSRSGAVTEAKPDYLKNPAPAYPSEARRNGWQGLVVLRVGVGADGRAMQIEVEQSSGFDILDESAQKTVKKWRFRPAKIGAMAVESQVRVPIRFELNK